MDRLTDDRLTGGPIGGACCPHIDPGAAASHRHVYLPCELAGPHEARSQCILTDHCPPGARDGRLVVPLAVGGVALVLCAGLLCVCALLLGYRWRRRRRACCSKEEGTGLLAWSKGSAGVQPGRSPEPAVANPP